MGTLALTGGLNVGVHIGPNGEPNFVAGSQAEMVLPVAFELDAGAAQVASGDHRNSGAVEQASGLLRLATPDRPWIATAAAAVTIALVLSDARRTRRLVPLGPRRAPFAPDNVRRIRRLALALALSEGLAPPSSTVRTPTWRHFAADHLRFTASPHTDRPRLSAR